jgi:hypothetical protein
MFARAELELIGTASVNSIVFYVMGSTEGKEMAIATSFFICAGRPPSQAVFAKNRAALQTSAVLKQLYNNLTLQANYTQDILLEEL